MIYLDHAAATPLHPGVAEAMARVQAEAFANPSSLHAEGRRARAVLEAARERILVHLGAVSTGPRRDRLVFTSGATEANRLGILGVADAAIASGRGPGRFLFTARDHASIRSLAGTMADRGFDPRMVPLDASGVPKWAEAIEPGIAGHEPAHRCDIATSTTVCGQTGVIDRFPPAAFFTDGFFSGNPVVHADATQACGWIDLDEPLAAATVAVAPHKFGGPRGIGGLLVRRDMPIAAVTPGPQESGLRGGTEAVVLAEGFATAMELMAADRRREATRIAGLRDGFERRVVASALAAGIAAEVIPADGVARSPHISTIAFPGLDRQAVVMAADLAGIACSTGTACASGSAEPSPAVVAMGFSRAIVAAAVRFSFGRTTREHDTDAAVGAIERMLPAMASSSRRTGGA